MKLNLRKLFSLSVAVLGVSFLASCGDGIAPELEMRKEQGLPVTKIELSESTIVLIGVQGKTSRVVTANVNPSYATNKTLQWFTSNPNVATVVPARDTMSAEIVLAGEGKCVVYAKSGEVFANVNVSASLEKTACGPVTNARCSDAVYPNHIIVCWDNPEDYDNDLDKVEVEVFKAGTLVKTVRFDAAAQEGDVRDLESATEYTFKLYTLDKNGNKSSGVATTSTGDEIKATTAEADTVAPQALETVNVTVPGDGSVVLTWVNNGASDNDVYYINIQPVPQDDDEVMPEPTKVMYPKKNGITSAKIDGLTKDKNYAFILTQLDEAFNESESYDTDVVRIVKAIYDIRTIKGAYSDDIKVEWTVDESFAYNNVLVEAWKNGAKIGSVATTKNGSALFENAGFATDIEIRIYGKDSETLSDFYIPAVVQAKPVVVRIINNYGNRVVAPNILGSSYSGELPSSPHVAAINYEDTSNWRNGVPLSQLKYTYWLKLHARNSNASYFSLMACEEDGSTDGRYLYIDTGSSIVINGSVPNRGWYGNADGFANKVGISANPDASNSSFKLVDNDSLGIGFKAMISAGNLYLQHENCVFLGLNPITGTDRSGFKFEEQ